MFKFVSTTFVNGKTYVDNTPAWFGIDGKTITYSDADAASAADMPTELKKDNGEVSLTLNHGNKFIKGNVTGITKAKWVAAAKDTLVITVPSLEAGLYRIHMYIRSVENADPMYANDFVYKGRPFTFEFTVKSGDTAATIASNIAKAANKWILLQFDNGKILKISASDTKVTIKATSEYQRFYTAKIQKFNEATNKFAYDGEYETVYDMEEDTSVFALTKGRTSFGMYTDLMRSVRQATNARWMANHPLRQYQVDEMPKLDGKYWEYVITQCTERPEMQGTSVLGQYNKSVTTHVVFVEDGVQSAFDTALAKVLSSGSIVEVAAGHKNTTTTSTSTPEVIGE